MKELYRYNYIAPSYNCTATSLSKEDIKCGYECNPDYYDDGLLSMLSKTINGGYLKSAMSTDEWSVVRDLICDGDAYKVFVGPLHDRRMRLHPSQLILNIEPITPT
jgi:hypothetical protein